jgi:hypothetical protein
VRNDAGSGRIGQIPHQHRQEDLSTREGMSYLPLSKPSPISGMVYCRKQNQKGRKFSPKVVSLCH